MKRVVLGVAMVLASVANAESPTAAEQADARLLVESTLGARQVASPLPPVSFAYGGRPFREACSGWAYEPAGHQGQTYGLSMWVPFHGTGTAGKDAGYYGEGNGPVDSYTFWSNVAPSTVLNFDMRSKERDYSDLRNHVALWRSVADDYAGDYYPLMAFSGADDQWIAWQFNRPEAGRGFVQAFRRPASPYRMAELRLRGLEPDALYEVRYLERADAPSEASGKDLMEKGLAVTIGERPGCAVIVYRKAKG